jgi:NAD(P)-dependent dehydrogenase (short-subunit alcohol dehydrogenase family)
VAEITAAGGVAVADYSDVATAGEGAVEACVREFGGVDVVISNAGQLEDKSIKNMTARALPRPRVPRPCPGAARVPLSDFNLKFTGLTQNLGQL